MSYLTDYNGLQVVMPDPPETDGLAINNNFKALSTYIAASDPGVDDDSTQGFSIGSRWYNSATSAEWVCLDATAGAADWVTINSLILAGFLPLTGGTLTGPLITPSLGGAAVSQFTPATNIVHISRQATGGDGTSGNPWTGWETWLNANFASGVTYKFDLGYYKQAATVCPSASIKDSAFIADPGTIIQYTGGGIAWDFDCYGIGDYESYFWNLRFADLTFDLDATGLAALKINGVHHSQFSRIRDRNFLTSAASTAFLLLFGVCNHYDDFTSTVNELDTQLPANGYVLGCPNAQYFYVTIGSVTTSQTLTLTVNGSHTASFTVGSDTSAAACVAGLRAAWNADSTLQTLGIAGGIGALTIIGANPATTLGGITGNTGLTVANANNDSPPEDCECTHVNPIFEGLTRGIWARNAFGGKVIGGASEQNSELGLKVESAVEDFDFDGLDLEDNNGGADANSCVSIVGARCSLRRSTSYQTITIDSSAQGTIIEGGSWNYCVNNGSNTIFLGQVLGGQNPITGSGTASQITLNFNPVAPGFAAPAGTFGAVSAGSCSISGAFSVGGATIAGTSISAFSSGTWINLPTTGPSGIGTGGGGAHPMLAYINANGGYLYDGVAGDSYLGCGGSTNVILLGNGGGTSYSTFAINGKNCGISNRTPSARLHLPAGTATASTSPLKLTAGTLLTTPEAGAFEFDGTHLYFTVGSSRYTIV